MSVGTSALLSRNFQDATYVLIAFITIYGVVASLLHYYRFKETFAALFRDDLRGEHDVYLPTPTFQGEFLVSLGNFRKDYIGNVSITGFAEEVPVATFCTVLEKPKLIRICSAHLGRGPDPIIVPYIFEKAVTKVKICLELEPAWTGRWVEEFAIYPEKGKKELVHVAVRERRT